MCGIAGIVSTTGVDAAALSAMSEAIRHRGPDGLGYLMHRRGQPLRVSEASGSAGGPASVGFAHRRLTILDLSEAAAQPMIDPEAGLALNFNGEIYNYLELQQELERRGHSFTSSGDTEVLLRAYAQWGPSCVRRLVGMWAFALLDLRRGIVLLSVDRFGIKPLYYTVSRGALHFASEIKALLAVPGIEPEPDEGAVRRYLMIGAVDESERTFFAGIRSLRGAHNLVVQLEAPGEGRPERYWSIPDSVDFAGSAEDAAEEFAVRFRDSIRVHTRSDVPVGTCLSGGLDSSAVVCVADELRRAGEIEHLAHHGFGYLPEDESVSERRFMAQVVERTGLEMTYVKPAPENFKRALQEIVRHQDEPFRSTSIAAQYFVFASAHEAGLKVMLDGQGADEILGGYHSYLRLIAAGHARRRQLLRYARFAREYRELIGTAPLTVPQAVGLMAPGSRRLERYMRRRAAAGRSPTQPGARLMTAQLRSRVREEDYAGPAHDTVNDILAAQTADESVPPLLRYEDRNSMAHSIEARVPFLDHRLVEFLFRLPGELKIRGTESKRLLREGMRGTLPEGIRTRRDKIGFRAEPTATWMLAREHRQALLANRTPYEELWLDPGALARLVDGGDHSEESEFLLWRAINTKLWLRSFWAEDGDPLAAP